MNFELEKIKERAKQEGLKYSALIKELRFGVRAVSGHRAAIWKVWTPGGDKHDVYLACRGLGGQLKASLHESGNWHISFTQDFFESEFADSKLSPPNRFVESWPRPQEIAAGVTLAYRVVVPWNSPSVATREESDDVIWVAPALEGQAVEFAVLLTHSNCSENDWPGKRSMGTNLVGCFRLLSGETLWVVYTSRPFQYPSHLNGSGQLFGNKSGKSLDSPNLRAVFFGSEPDGSRVVYDVPICAKYADG